jgi:hypothetical protein
MTATPSTSTTQRTRVGIGLSTLQDASTAGREAATAALAELGPRPADFLLVFGTTGYDQLALLEAVAQAAGGVPMSGCSGEGIIARAFADEGSHVVAVTALASDELRFDPIVVREVSNDPVGSADALAAAVAERAVEGDDKLLLVFPDGLQCKMKAVLDRLHEKLAESVLVVGGGAGGILDTWQTYQYHHREVLQNAVSAVLVQGRFVAEVAVSHGCRPIGLERLVTKATDGNVYTIDDKPAFDVFKEYVDGNPDELRATDLVHLCLGRELSREHRDGYGKLIIAAPAGLEKDTGAIFFPAGIEEGDRVYMTRRDPTCVRDSAVSASKKIVAAHPDEEPLLVLQFDCAGRGRQLFGSQTTAMTVTPLQELFASAAPWVGFHSYGEIAPLQGKPYYHNYTVALLAIYSRPHGCPASNPVAAE